MPTEHLQKTTSAIIFDMDGLMFDTESISLRSWHDVGRAFGVEITDEHIIPLCGLPTPKFLDTLAEKLPPDADMGAMHDHSRSYIHKTLERDGVPLKPGLIELLTALRERGTPTAVATSTDREAALWMLERAGVRKYFSAVICGDEIENGKPNPDIYLAAARKLGVQPHLCVALEDAPIGATAAVRAGMRVIMVPDFVQPPPELEEQLYAKVQTLHDVIQFLD